MRIPPRFWKPSTAVVPMLSQSPPVFSLHPQVLRHLGWELAARNIGLIMAPALTDIAGPRIHTQQVAGLPLIHVTTPTLEGGQRVAKRLFDVIVSGILIVLASPVMAAVAGIVKLDSLGPNIVQARARRPRR